MAKVIVTKIREGRTNLYNGRFYASKRTDMVGRTHWCVYDLKENRYSIRMCFGSYRLMKDCEWAIRHAVENAEKYGINLE